MILPLGTRIFLGTALVVVAVLGSALLVTKRRADAAAAAVAEEHGQAVGGQHDRGDAEQSRGLAVGVLDLLLSLFLGGGTIEGGVVVAAAGREAEGGDQG
jgi:hypothetical protein